MGAWGSVLFCMAPPHGLQAWGGGKINLWSGLERPVMDETRDGPPDYMTGASVLLSVAALRRVGLFDEGFFMYWEDADLGFRLRKGGYRTAVAPGARVLHEEHGSGSNAGGLAFMFHESEVRFLRKHAPVPLVPILVSAVLRMARRLSKGELSVSGQILRGGGERPPAGGTGAVRAGAPLPPYLGCKLFIALDRGCKSFI